MKQDKTPPNSAELFVKYEFSIDKELCMLNINPPLDKIIIIHAV